MANKSYSGNARERPHRMISRVSFRVILDRSSQQQVRSCPLRKVPKSDFLASLMVRSAGCTFGTKRLVPTGVPELPGLLHELPEDLVVFAEEPWIPGANAMLLRLEPDFPVPEDIKKSTFRYFLELSIIREFIDDLRAAGLTEAEQLKVMIHYATYDAFPDWLLERSRFR